MRVISYGPNNHVVHALSVSSQHNWLFSWPWARATAAKKKCQ